MSRFEPYGNLSILVGDESLSYTVQINVHEHFGVLKWTQLAILRREQI